LKKALLILATLAVYVLHQDIWFWRTARPLVFGFLPVGLAYHAFFSCLAALLMWLLVSRAWPTELEAQAERHVEKKDAP
jgi:hypothetical protein